MDLSTMRFWAPLVALAGALLACLFLWTGLGLVRLGRIRQDDDILGRGIGRIAIAVLLLVLSGALLWYAFSLG